MKLLILIISLIISPYLFSQRANQILPVANNIIDNTNERNTNSKTFIWNNSLVKINNEYKFNIENIIGFSCFGIGVKSNNAVAKDFEIKYRFNNNEWNSSKFEYELSETKTGYIWSELNFSSNHKLQNSIEIIISSNKDISELRLDIMDILSDSIQEKVQLTKVEKNTLTCPQIPNMIGRDIWLDPYFTQPSYTPLIIYPDHIVIHHGASPDTYTDGAAIVRSYWNYHVNTLGWSDIGYNFLTDKYGNIYQGRMNSNIVGQDVRGAHAGAANNESIGINFLGNSDVTLPTTSQLQTCNQFMAWWFDSRGYDPTTSASMTTQNSGILVIPRISGHRDVNIGGTACPGNALYLEIPGMRTGTKAIIDACNTPPTTTVSSTGTWKTVDFNASFNDIPGNSGIKTKFYQVIDFDGTDWKANNNNGFYADNFDNLLDTNWTNFNGTWATVNGYLNQSNETSSNTILTAELNQNSNNKFMYAWSAKIGGTGANRRAGLHFYCDNESLPNRGNSYFVYFRVESESIEIYKVENDVFNMVANVSYLISENTVYDYKIIFDKISGEIDVYVDDTKQLSWTDINPLNTTGDYISFRTGNCIYDVSDLQVYHSRTSSQTITLGDITSDIRYQNQNYASSSAKVKSIVVDSIGLLSNLFSHNINVDWTLPTSIITADGLIADIDTIYSANTISANWTKSTDINSAIDSYFYCIGTSSGANDILSWTSTNLDTNITNSSLSLTHNQMYYVSVKSQNNAGLFSQISTSDGVYLAIATVAPNADFILQSEEICEGDSAIFINTSDYGASYYWEFIGGLPTTSTDINPNIFYSTSGNYNVKLIAYNSISNDTIISTFSININITPFADFYTTDTVLFLPNALASFIDYSTNTNSYLWNFGDGTSSTDQNPIHQYNNIGTYTISLNVNNGGCNDYLEIVNHINVFHPAIIKDFAENNIIIYPNPASSFIKLDGSIFKVESVKIIDISGKIIRNLQDFDSLEGLKLIDISNLERGIYYIVIHTKNKIINKRFIKI